MKIEIKKDVNCIIMMIIYRRTNSREKHCFNRKKIQIKTQRKKRKSRNNEMKKFMMK